MKKRKQLQSLLNRKDNILLVGPTRSGKSVGWVIPTLLGEWTESAIVTDMYGENWRVTAGYRQKVMGQKVIKFDPTSADGTSARFNPFNEVRFGTKYEIRDIISILDIILNNDGNGDLDELTLSVRNLLVGLICHIHYAHIKDPHNNPSLTLNQLAKILKGLIKEDPENPGNYEWIACIEFIGTLTQYQHWPESGMEMQVIDSDRNSKTYGERKMVTVTTEYMRTLYPETINLTKSGLNLTHPIAFEAFIDFVSKAENERASVVSKANALLTLYSDPVLAMNTYDSDFTLYDVMNYQAPVTLYLIASPLDIIRIQPLFRLLIEMIVRNNIGTMKFENGKPIDTFKHRCLLLLDEFPALGRMDTFEKQLAYIAGSGLKSFIVCRGLQQLQQIYTKENSIVINCPIQIFHNPKDVLTYSEIKNRLGFAEELDVFLSVKGDKELIFMIGEKPILSKKLKYYMNNYFNSRVMNPPPTSDIIPK